jgi:hypothetical protein
MSKGRDFIAFGVSLPTRVFTLARSMDRANPVLASAAFAFKVRYQVGWLQDQRQLTTVDFSKLTWSRSTLRA